MSLSAPTNVVAGYDSSNNLYSISWTQVPGLYQADKYEVTINGNTHLISSNNNTFVYKGEGDNKVSNSVIGGPWVTRVGLTSGRFVFSNRDQYRFDDAGTYNGRNIDWTTKKFRTGFYVNNTSIFTLDDNSLWNGGGNYPTAPSLITTTGLSSEIICSVNIGSSYTVILTASGKVKTGITDFIDISGIDWTTNKAVSICSVYGGNIDAITMADGTVYLGGSARNFIPQKMSDFDGVTRKVVDFKYMGYNGATMIALLDNGRIMTKGNSSLVLGRGYSANGATFDYVYGVDGVAVKAKRIFTSDGEYARWWAFITEDNVAYVVGTGDTIGNGDTNAYTPVLYSVQSPYNRVVEFSGGGSGGTYADHMIAIMQDGSIYGSGYNHANCFGNGYRDGLIYSTPVPITINNIANTPITSPETFNITVATKRLATVKSSAVSASIGNLPAKPTTLAVNQSNQGTVSLSWNAVSTATKYTITTTNRSYTTTSTSIDISGLLDITNYTFNVYASNAFGNGYPTSISIYVTPYYPKIKSIVNNSNVITANWESVNNSNSYTVTVREVKTNGAYGSSVSTIISDPTARSAVLTLTPSGSTLGYRSVEIYGTTNGVNTLLDIALLSTSNVFIRKPSNPLKVNASAGNRNVTLVWTEPENNGGSNITSYKITSNPGNIINTVDGTYPFASIYGLTNGVQYTHSVVAVNPVGQSEPTSSLPTASPIQASDTLTTSMVTSSSVPIQIGSVVRDVPVVSTLSDASNNSFIVVNDTTISSTPIVAYYVAPTNDTQIGSAVNTAISNNVSKVAITQSVAGQNVKSLVNVQSASVATPLTITNSSGASAAITTNSAGSGNYVAASITNMDVSNSYVNMFIKVVNSSGSIISSGFSVPIEINVPSASGRDSIVLKRFNTSTNAFETVGTMAKKSGTTSTFQYTLTSNSNLTVVPCILGHTKVMTPRGPVAAAFLKNGDIIVTSEGRQVAINQIYTSSYVTTKETAPYKFEKGCLGKNYPTESFEISPTHAVSVPGGWIIPKYASLSGIELEQVMVGERVKYYHIELDNYLRDNLVLEGGAIVESFGVNWLKSQPKNTVVYTFDHKSKLFTRPSYKSMKKITVNRK
jgi:hypothetical protein